MRRKRNFSTFLYLTLKKLGLLKKKSQPYRRPKIRVQKTLNINGEIGSHEDFMFAKNNLPTTKKTITKDGRICHYDFVNNTCRCGLNIHKLKEGSKCPLDIPYEK